MITEVMPKAVLIGLILALPTGPVGILCLRRTLVAGRRAGLISAAGACLADLFYVIVVRVGLIRVQQLISARRFALQIVAGAIVIAAGYRIIVKPSGPVIGDQNKQTGLFASTFFLSAGNPTLLVSIPALFAVMHFPASSNVLASLISAFLIGAGSLAWWFTITSLLDRSSTNISDQGIRRVSTLTGIALIVLGLISISSLMA